MHSHQIDQWVCSIKSLKVHVCWIVEVSVRDGAPSYTSPSRAEGGGGRGGAVDQVKDNERSTVIPSCPILNLCVCAVVTSMKDLGWKHD